FAAFVFTVPPTSEFYPLSLHDALPIFVLIGFYLEFVDLRTVVEDNFLGLALLLGKHRGDSEPAKLQLCFYAKERLISCDQTSADRKIDLSHLDLPDDLIFVTRVFKLDLVFEIKLGLAVVVGGHPQLLSDIPHQVHLNILIEIK